VVEATKAIRVARAELERHTKEKRLDPAEALSDSSS
jgi:hypothetical protein